MKNGRIKGTSPWTGRREDVADIGEKFRDERV
jgi:hypothetical protein